MNMLNVWMDIYSAMIVKMVNGSGQKSILQITLHNGTLYFEQEGRPDGLRPQQAASYFELYRTQQLLAQQQHTLFKLSEDAHALLLQELLLFYARCMAFLKLVKHQPQAQKDAVQILRIVHFLKQYGQADQLAAVMTFAAFFNELYAYAFSAAPTTFGHQPLLVDLEQFIAKTTSRYFQPEQRPKKPAMMFTQFDEN